MTDEEHLIFLMKGRKVTKVAADHPKRLTNKQWYRKTKDDPNERVTR